MPYLWYLPLFILIYMSLWFFASFFLKRRDIIDVAWGPGFFFLALISFNFRDSAGFELRSLLLLSLIFLWNLRLFIHTCRRNLKKEEDWRYRKIKDDGSFLAKLKIYFQVFIFQGLLMMLVSLPVVYSLQILNLPLYNINYFGLALAIIGLSLETVADNQRYKFLLSKENKNTFTSHGLWRYSRHPNYFGELLFWWGIYFFTLGSPASWALIVSPLSITYVLIFISGIPMEERFAGNKDFKEYKRKTSPFIPWPPRK